MLLLRCGDVEQNPGLDLNPLISSEGSAFFPNSLNFVNNFSVVPYDVQSKASKIDLLVTIT